MFGILYVAMQQSFRQAANEPQLSMAQDAAKALNRGSRPSDVAGGRRVDMAYDADPFLIVYDKTGRVVAGKGYLEGKVPEVPVGVLQAATEAQPNKVSWEPTRGVRIAATSVVAHSYYVLGGRSLAKAEAAIDTVGRYLLGAWLVALALIVLCSAIVRRLPGRQQ